jgi:protein-L-isoaspartate(D-aspartate) O-methyltransferase
MDDGCWPQFFIEWADWDTSEHTAAQQLWPALAHADQDGLLGRWFFIRKTPHWRLRYTGGTEARSYLTHVLDQLTTTGAIAQWDHGIYEPETTAFGGEVGMDAAHTLFHLDCRNTLAYLSHLQEVSGDRRVGRRELGVLLMNALHRGAGLDWYEKGDVWVIFGRHREAQDTLSAPGQRAKMQTLLTANTAQLVHIGSELHEWIDAHTSVGQQLADHARHGRLQRGLRAVLAHHMIFTFNCLGLPFEDQKTLSELAREVVFTNPMTSDQFVSPSTEDEAQRLRNSLADQLRAQGHITNDRVDKAVRSVPRHVFIPDTPLADAYTNQQIYTKHDPTSPLSAASQPSIVTMMLSQLQVHEGHSVLEIGAGTGYNAALMAHLTGPSGYVTTIDVDDDLVTAARAHLTHAGTGNVEVILGDGALGHSDNAPYDRIIATVGTADLPAEWLKQTTQAGRLVVPVRINGSVTRSITFERDGDQWSSVDSQLCGFMPLRASVAADPRRILELTEDGAVKLWGHREQNIDARTLHGVFDSPAHKEWTGIEFAKADPLDSMWLWLACALPNSLSRMPVESGAIESGLVTPMLGWGSMTTVAADSLAYLTMRPTSENRHEVGIIGHGPYGSALAGTMAREITKWSAYRSASLAFKFLPGDTAPSEPVQGDGEFVIHRPSGIFIVTWQA